MRRSNSLNPTARRLRSSNSKPTLLYDQLEKKCLLAGVFYESPTTVVSMESLIGSFDGTTFADDPTIVDTFATLEDPANPDPPDYDGPVRAIVDKLGNTLYPTDTEFGFYVEDFIGAEQKVRDGYYAEGWIGNIVDDQGEIIGVSISNAATDTFKSGAPLGTWAAGLGGNSVKASTEHYVVMQSILSDQRYPGDPNALNPLDDNLVIIGGINDGRFATDVIAELQNEYDMGNTSVDVFPYNLDGSPGGDGIIDIRDVLIPNEDSVTENIAASSDYSITMKDDGKLLYRWGQMIKRPNDIRLGVQVDLPSEWLTPGAQLINQGQGYRVTGAELIVTHAITNNPNDQIRPEDYENEGATGRTPSYLVIEHPDFPGDPDYALWVSPVNDFAGDGTFLPSYFELDENGQIVLDGNGDPIVNVDDMGNPIGTIFREVTPDNHATSILVSSDLIDGFTNAWYTTMDRDPFEPVFDQAGDYVVGPRWRLKANKFGQDIPGVEIPRIPHSQPPFQKDNIKYEVGELTTTTINLLDWEAGDTSPFLYSNGWVYADQLLVNEDGVTVNGLKLSDQLDVAFYVKGDAKATQVYDVRLRLTYDFASTVVVTNTNDAGAGSLREAIITANTEPGVQQIVFDIPGDGPHTIQPLSELPALADAVVLDATTQNGYSDLTPMIEIDGTVAGVDADGLTIQTSGAQVIGLTINRFDGDGIEVYRGADNYFANNFIGTDVTGELDFGNGGFGIHLIRSADNMVTGNTLSGNSRAGIGIRGVEATGNMVGDNLVGTNATGDTGVGNHYGIIVAGEASHNSLGFDGSPNTISGNHGVGIYMNGSTVNNNYVVANRIGTDHEGLTAIGNATYGIYLFDSPFNRVRGNLVSGNSLNGLIIQGPNAVENILTGNWVGTDVTGMAALPNVVYGIRVFQGASNNRIGGTGEDAANVLSGNMHSGLIFTNATTMDNVVIGNLIGTDAAGTQAIPNHLHGVVLTGGTTGNQIGGLMEGFGNTISGNTNVGLLASTAANGNSVVGNRIGSDTSGEVAVGNGSYGIHIVSSSDNYVGDNWIVASGLQGVTIRGEASTDNVLVRNQIGRIGASDDPALANGHHGILITEGASQNRIGGNQADLGNTIAFNLGSGVAVDGNGIGNQIRLNSIFGNRLWGIDLGSDGRTVNDPGDADTGPNYLMNYPVISNATLNGSTLQLAYSIDSDLANANYPIVVDFYVADSNGQEGKTYFFSDTFTQDDIALGIKIVSINDADFVGGNDVVATSTDANGVGSTSEFSPGFSVS